MTPERIQRRRTKGWRIPPNTVCVSRPSKWGNPFIVRQPPLVNAMWRVTGPGIVEACGIQVRDEHEARRIAVRRFELHLGPFGVLEADDMDEYLAPLRGKNLACWCPLDMACHADVLLRLANRQD